MVHRLLIDIISRVPLYTRLTMVAMPDMSPSAETIEIAGITMSANPGNRPFPDLSTIKAVLFDVDGTLTNSDPLHFDAFHDILLDYGYKVSFSGLFDGYHCYNFALLS